MADFSDLNNRIKHAVILAAVGLTCLLFKFTTVLLVAGLLCIFFVEVAGALTRNHERPYSTKTVLLTLAFLAVGIVGFASALYIRFEKHGLYDLLLVALGVAATDTFAYVGGKYLGKRKFAPNISPNKTWEGVLIGFDGGVIVLAGTWLALNATHNTSLSMLQICLIAVCLPVVAVCGDLLESKAKRLLGVKDFSKLLGDHGGVADRFDAMTAAFVFFGFVTFALHP